MIGLLLKNWKLILDILVVIALVVLLFLWNPLGIFGGGLRLTPTTNMVTEIREIGQLVTAEYSGEVIASIDEARLNVIEEEDVGQRAALLYTNLYAAMIDLREFQAQPVSVREAEYKEGQPFPRWKRVIRHEVKTNNIMDKLVYQESIDLTVDPLYGEILQYIWENEYNRAWRASSSQKEEALFLLYSRAERSLAKSLDESVFRDFHFRNKAANISNREKKKKLAMIGRGWVKAGFDFGELDSHNFYISDNGDEVHFFGLSPTVLNADINPWFIPEKGVPGFEILDYNGKVDFRDAKKVKQYCIEKLVMNAYRADILKSAEENGAETLKSLFSLITGKKIDKVVFHNDRIIQLSQEIAADEKVSYQEAYLLDSLLIGELHQIDSLRMTNINSQRNQQQAFYREESVRMALKQLQQLPFEETGDAYNYFSKNTFVIAADSMVENGERQELDMFRTQWQAGEHPPNKPPPFLFFDDSLSFQSSYSDAIAYLLKRNVVLGEIQVDSLSQSLFTPQYMEENWVRDYHYIHGDNVQVVLVNQLGDQENQLTEMLYPFTYHADLWSKLVSKSRIWLDSLPADRGMIPSMTDSTVWVYDKGAIKEMAISLHHLIHPHLLDLWSNKRLIPVSEDLCFIQRSVHRDILTGEFDSLFSPSQAREMEAFYRLLLQENQSHFNRGPILRASEWVQSKLANNKSVRHQLAGRSKIMK